MNVLEGSLIRFSYAFAFDGASFDARRLQVDRASWPEHRGLWESQPFATDDFLPQAARYLDRDAAIPTGALWQLGSAPLQSVSGLGGGRKIPQANWYLRVRKRELPFELVNVRLALFRVGMGFLTFTAQPTGNEIGQGHDFLSFFRFTRGQRGIGIGARRAVPQGADLTQKEAIPFFPEMAGGTTRHRDGTGVTDDLIAGLMRTAQCDEDAAQWWRDVFVPGQLIPYAAFLVDDVSPEDIAALVYRTRNFFHQRQEIRPGADELSGDWLQPYVKDQWFTFSLEGGTFVAANPPQTEFFRHTLPDLLRRAYFTLFLLAMHQRAAFTEFNDRIAQHWLTAKDETTRRARDDAFELLYEDILAFSARGQFAQVSQRQHHHQYYTHWHRTLQIDTLYQEVRDNVASMHEHLQAQRTFRLEHRINMLAALLGAPGLVLSFLGINLYGITSEAEGLPWGSAALVAFGGGLLLGAAALWLMRR